MTDKSSFFEVQKKLEYYCSYQERCHREVTEKLRAFPLSYQEKQAIIVHLIENQFLNEERFALLFAHSKLNQKRWGKNRIKQELKARNIAPYLVTKALNALEEEHYQLQFELLATKTWDSILEKNTLKKRKKFCDTLLRKGWESDKVYEKALLFEKSS